MESTVAHNVDQTGRRRAYPYHKRVEIEYSKRPDGQYNKRRIWSAADWHDWRYSSVEDDLLAHLDYPMWVLVDVVNRPGA